MIANQNVNFSDRSLLNGGLIIWIVCQIFERVDLRSLVSDRHERSECRAINVDKHKTQETPKYSNHSDYLVSILNRSTYLKNMFFNGYLR